MGSACMAGQVDLSVTGAGSPVEEPQPLDLVAILDRTSSLTSTDLTHVKDAAKLMLQLFDPAIQYVALGVLGPSTSWASPCDSSPEGIWLPVNLSDDYQNPDGTLDESSRLVSTILCLPISYLGTDLGSPLAAAIDELQANGRSHVRRGIILLTDGAANTMPSLDKGFRNPTANAAVTSGSGDNNGFQTNPTYAYGDDSNYAVDTDSGTSTSTGCGDTGKDRHDFYNYGLAVPGDNTITGVEVRLDARIDSTSSSTSADVRAALLGRRRSLDVRPADEQPGNQPGNVHPRRNRRHLGSHLDTRATV